MEVEQQFDWELNGKKVTIYYDLKDPHDYECCAGDDQRVLDLSEEDQYAVWLAVQDNLGKGEYTYADYLADQEYDRRSEDDS